MPLGEDATGNASRLRDKKNISWQYQMPCSLSVPEPLLVVDSLARQREFRADAGSARILGSPRPMISALQRLGGMEPGELPRQLSAFGINGGTGGMGMLFASHPPIEQRIAALKALGS